MQHSPNPEHVPLPVASYKSTAKVGDWWLPVMWKCRSLLEQRECLRHFSLASKGKWKPFVSYLFFLRSRFFFFKEPTTKKYFCPDLCCFFICIRIRTIYLRAESLGFLMKKKSSGFPADLQCLHAANSVTCGSLCISGNNILISREGYGDLWGTCFSLEE